MLDQKTAIITGASGGIGTGLVEAFLKEGYHVVATSRHASQSLTASPHLVLVDGDIGKQETAAKVVDAAIRHSGTIDVLVNTAGIYVKRPFIDFTTEDFNALVSTNLLGFLYMVPRIRSRVPMQRNSRANIRTGLSRAASGTIFRKKRRRLLLKQSLKLTAISGSNEVRA